MQVVNASAEMNLLADQWRRAGHAVGLVPTMGCLHAGHLSLVKLARAKADKIILSVFVNPTQFGPNEDFKQYPRDFERDAALCRDAGVDAVFHPAPPENMYAPDHSVQVQENALTRGLCGASRPGHFAGVLTVVAKLFNITRADVAVFGQKDAQQARAIRRMARDLNFPVSIIIAPLIREPDGLAMSSRNAYLSPSERRDALCLMRALQLARRLYREGARDAEDIRRRMVEQIQQTPAARIDYAEIVDEATLEPVKTIERPILAALAVRIGQTRLIDNLLLPDDRLCSLPGERPLPPCAAGAQG